MREKHNPIKYLILIVLSLVLSLAISGCELSQTNKMPATPTMVQVEIPVIEAETETEEDESVVPETEDEIASEPVEEVEEAEEEMDIPAATETPKPQPTPTEEPMEAETVEEETVEEIEPTPTAIPYETTANKDPMVLIYSKTNCYASPDMDAEVIGVALGGTALGAFERQWNWYKVVHPTKGGWVCWLTGDSIRPNQTAFNLDN
ncbi:MAG: hypothetical protein V2J07_09550 [Anaerolineae bacterium]|jgi:hypothetical protein|nr:hypothetical protein [Anaerolineae bacterium]